MLDNMDAGFDVFLQAGGHEMNVFLPALVPCLDQGIKSFQQFGPYQIAGALFLKTKLVLLGGRQLVEELGQILGFELFSGSGGSHDRRSRGKPFTPIFPNALHGHFIGFPIEFRLEQGFRLQGIF